MTDKLQTYRIRDLNQVKALAHPLRVKIIETLASGEPMTTKQVADHLGEKPTRLYHHVDLLEKAGLIRLQRTQQNRGTIEKYFEAIARQFQADSGLFSEESAEDADGAMRPMLHTIFDTTLSELLRLIDAHDLTDTLEEEGLLSFIEMHLTQEQIDDVRDRLNAILEHLKSFDDGVDDDSLRKYRLTTAYYPLDRFDVGDD